MDRSTLNSGLTNYFGGQSLTQDELDNIKEVFSSSMVIPFVTDSAMGIIEDTDLTNYQTRFNDFFISVVNHILDMRYGKNF